MVPPALIMQFPVESSKHPESSLSPLAKVEVAVEEELIPPPIWRSPAMLTLFEKVEEAVEVNPAKLENPVERRPPENVEEAVEVMFRFPVELIFPPVMVSPAELASPAEEIPPAKVEVAVEVDMIEETERFPDTKF